MIKYNISSYYTINEVATMLNANYNTIYRIIKTNSIPVIKTKNYSLVRGSDVSKIKNIYFRNKRKSNVFKKVTKNVSRKR